MKVLFKRASRLAAAAIVLALMVGCREAGLPQFQYADAVPERLSAWGVLAVDRGIIQAPADAMAYTLASPLFSDQALKFRTLHLPEGGQVKVTESGRFDYPVGTVISKTFFYVKAGNQAAGPSFLSVSNLETDFPDDLRGQSIQDLALVETRLLVRRAAGWQALPYRWLPDQQDAVLMPAGDLFVADMVSGEAERGAGEKTSFAYQVPNQNQCAGCHVLNQSTKALEPIGPHQKHLASAGLGRQLEAWNQRGWLATTDLRADLAWQQVDYKDESASLEARARSYLDINCGHCHSPTGPADTSGLYLNGETVDRVRLGWCKAPIAAGQGTGGRQFGIVPGHPEDSILVYRMQSEDPGAMMPELGRSLLHDEGIQLVADWIAAMPDTGCYEANPSPRESMMHEVASLTSLSVHSQARHQHLGQ